MFLHITQNSNSINCLITIIPKQNFYICKFLNITSLIPLLRLPSKCFSWHWKDHVIFVAADINSSKSRWQSLHNIFNTFLYWICSFLSVFGLFWSHILGAQNSWIDIFVRSSLMTRQLSCHIAVLLDINDCIFPMSFNCFKAGYEELARGSKPMTSRNYIVWLNKITEDVKIDIQ